MLLDSYMPVKIISGKNCFSEKGACISCFGNKCIIVTGRASAVKSGVLNDAEKILKDNNIDYVIFNEIEPNPETATCKKAGDLARGFGAQFVLGLGGGSVLDAAKAIAIFACNPTFSHDGIYSREVPSAHLPVVLVGITAGTGSEVTGVSVLTNSDNMQKKSISGPDCYADISFCDYSYTKSATVDTRISTALDAFSHAIESFVASSSNNLSETYSIKALELLAEYLVSGKINNCLDDSDFEKLYVASLYAGLAINISGTCFAHTVGYYLTESHNVPHGKACAAFIEELVTRAKKYCPLKLEAILEAMKTTEESLICSIMQLADVHISASDAELEEVCARWRSSVKNFDRTPGGYCAERAFENLKRLTL